jgi:uncharacterized protein YhhL (DUF1145 family)
VEIYMFDLFANFVKAIIKSWATKNIAVRAAILFASGFGIAGSILSLTIDVGYLSWKAGETLSVIFLATAGLMFSLVAIRERLQEELATQENLKKVEERARQHPDKPQFAWDLARAKLENYLDRNIGQLKSIFLLTSCVMLVGFFLVVYGLAKAYERPDRLAVSVVGSASGVLISFVGGSFLLIYKSTLAQTEHYMKVLERINAVGMAVHVLESIAKDAKLKNRATALLAQQLLGLYRPSSQATSREAEVDSQLEDTKADSGSKRKRNSALPRRRGRPSR